MEWVSFVFGRKKSLGSTAFLCAFSSSLVMASFSSVVSAENFDSKFDSQLKQWLISSNLGNIANDSANFLKLRNEYAVYLGKYEDWSGNELPSKESFDRFIKSNGINWFYLGGLFTGFVGLITLGISFFWDSKKYHSSKQTVGSVEVTDSKVDEKTQDDAKMDDPKGLDDTPEVNTTSTNATSNMDANIDSNIDSNVNAVGDAGGASDTAGKDDVYIKDDFDDFDRGFDDDRFDDVERGEHFEDDKFDDDKFEKFDDENI